MSSIPFETHTPYVIPPVCQAVGLMSRALTRDFFAPTLNQSLLFNQFHAWKTPQRWMPSSDGRVTFHFISSLFHYPFSHFHKRVKDHGRSLSRGSLQTKNSKLRLGELLPVSVAFKTSHTALEADCPGNSGTKQEVLFTKLILESHSLIIAQYL